jgi:predicted thioredoxin/glutaredoxin
VTRGSASRLTLVTREDCGLCEEFHRALAEASRSRALPPIELKDVDADTDLRRRYGLDVPVLLLDGERVCAHELDLEELDRLLRPR